MSWFIPPAWSSVDQCRWFLLRPMTSIQKLTRFQNHFDDMFVAVIFRTFTGVQMEKEDVHFVGVGVVTAAWVSGVGGNTFWLKRSSAFAGSIPRYTISSFNFRSAVRRDSGAGILFLLQLNTISYSVVERIRLEGNIYFCSLGFNDVFRGGILVHQKIHEYGNEYSQD